MFALDFMEKWYFYKHFERFYRESQINFLFLHGELLYNDLPTNRPNIENIKKGASLTVAKGFGRPVGAVGEPFLIWQRKKIL